MFPYIDPESAHQMGIPFVTPAEQASRAAALQYLSDLDEDLTVWDTELELDTDAGQVIRGRNLFKWIALTEGLDAALVADARVSARRQAVSTILETTPGLEG